MRKTILFTITAILFTIELIAQTFEWARSIGGSSSDFGQAITIDASGNVYTTGGFLGNVDFDPGSGTSNLTSVGDIDVFIQKLDESGNFLWARSFGGSSQDIGSSIVLDASNNVYIIGTFELSVDFDPGPGITTLTSAGSRDVFIQKLDASGNFLWAKSFGSLSIDEGSAISIDASGNVYATGRFTGTVDFDPGSGTANLTSPGNSSVFIQKLDASGNFLWAKSFGGSSLDVGIDITVDVSGNVYTTGYFRNTVDFNPGTGTAMITSVGGDDVFIQKLDASGNFVWVKSFGGSLNDVGFSINVDSIGNIYTTGYFSGTVDFDPGAATANRISAGGIDVFVQKLDASGNFLWAKTLGGSFTDFGNSSSIDNLGNVYTVGSFQGIVDFNPGSGTASKTSAGSADIYVQKLDTDGNFLWAQVFGGSSNDNGNDVIISDNGKIHITGYYSTNVDFDPGVGTANFTSFGIKDIFVLKLSQSTGTPITKAPYDTLDISIYPNPTTGKINIELGELKEVSIKVHSVDGQLIYSKENIKEAVHVFDVKEAVGVYLVEVEAKEGKIYYKLVKN